MKLGIFTSWRSRCRRRRRRRILSSLMFAQVGLNKKVNLQYFSKRPDCTVFYCLSLALWVKVGSIGLAVVITVVFFGWICWFCQKRRKNKQENQVQTELSEKDKKGHTELRGLCDYTSPSDQRWFAKSGVSV